jgi:hypothetical protein
MSQRTRIIVTIIAVVVLAVLFFIDSDPATSITSTVGNRLFGSVSASGATDRRAAQGASFRLVVGKNGSNTDSDDIVGGTAERPWRTRRFFREATLCL